MKNNNLKHMLQIKKKLPLLIESNTLILIESNHVAHSLQLFE